MNIWTIILAAGEGKRFGGPKALGQWKSGTLLSHAVSVAPEPAKTVIVIGAHEMPDCNAVQVHNARWREGMGTSIAAGIQYVQDHGADVALILPADQPFVTAEHLQALAQQAASERRCILTQDGDVIGPPAAVPLQFFAALTGLKDKGLKSVLADYGVCEAPGMVRDADTPDELARLQAL